MPLKMRGKSQQKGLEKLDVAIQLGIDEALEIIFFRILSHHCSLSCCYQQIISSNCTAQGTVSGMPASLVNLFA